MTSHTPVQQKILDVLPPLGSSMPALDIYQQIQSATPSTELGRIRSALLALVDENVVALDNRLRVQRVHHRQAV